VLATASEDDFLDNETLPEAEAHHRIIIGDARRMREIEDESVHLVATSPPYWSIKDYGVSKQIGFGQSLDRYMSDLGKVWKECVRALKPGCRMCINVGDQYVRAKAGTPYHIVPIHARVVNRVIELSGGSVAYLGSIIWQKISTTRTSGGASVMGSFGYPRNGCVSFDFEYIAIFRKRGVAPPPPEDKEASRISLSEWRALFNGHWRFPGVRQAGQIAAFPEKLPRRLIRMFTYPGDTVLDPFLGSGTTTKVARAMRRNSVGYEIGFRTEDGRPFSEVIKEKVGYYSLPVAERDAVFSIEG
jgi:site-specific DNA-methyltransferase (adenine-specific)